MTAAFRATKKREPDPLSTENYTDSLSGPEGDPQNAEKLKKNNLRNTSQTVGEFLH